MWVARKDQCQTQLAPSSSATNLQQDTAEPVSEASGVSCEGILKEKVKYQTGKGEGKKAEWETTQGTSRVEEEELHGRADFQSAAFGDRKIVF